MSYELKLNIWSARISQAAFPKKEIVATYNYVDETNKLLYQNVRFEPKNSDTAGRITTTQGNGFGSLEIQKGSRLDFRTLSIKQR